MQKIVIIPLTLLMIGQSVNAAPGEHKRFPIDISKIEERQAERFASLDQNNDGLIALAEFEQAQPKHNRRHHRTKNFTRADADSGREARGGERAEKRLAKKERKMRHMRRNSEKFQERRASRTAAVQAELFKILDSNGDGTLSSDEFATSSRENRHLAKRRATFAQLDTDGDGSLQAPELGARVERLKQMDTDQNGLVSRQEMRSAIKNRS